MARNLNDPVTMLKGVGPKKRDILLKIFGTSDKIAQASIEELKSVNGINHNLATVIYNHFNKKQ